MLDMCVCFVLFVYVDVGGPFFFVGGGGDSVGGEGGVGDAFRQWMCCAFFCGFCLSAWWGPFSCRGGGGQGLDK